MPDLFNGKGYSEKPLTEEELRQHRQRSNHYDSHVAPYAKLLSFLSFMRSKVFWTFLGATASLGYALKSGVLVYAFN